MMFRQRSPIASTRGEQMSLRAQRSNLRRSPRSPSGSLAMTHRGYALLLAVVITSAVLSTASALAGIIIAEIRQTRQTSGAIAAYARAEESSERAIFLLRQSDIALAELTPLLPVGTTIVPHNEAQGFAVPEDDFIALPIATDAVAPVNPRIITWDFDAPSCPNVSWIEVTAISWDPSGSPDSPFRTIRQPYSREANFEPSLDLTLSFPPGTPVELRIRALYCDIDDLEIENIPGRYRIVARGQQGDVAQAIETFITRKPPASGLFDFVLFSECEVIKGGGGDPSCPPPTPN